MNTSKASYERARDAENVLRVAALVAAMRAISTDHQTKLHQQSLSVERPSQPTAETEFRGRVPFGFAFTEGHEANFHVPSAHRFVIERMHIACWAPNEHVDVQLVTRSRRMFRSLTVTDWPSHTSSGQEPESPSVAPIQVYGSSASTFLFGSGAGHTSSTVPPDTYLQIWGYLEPTDDAESF